MTDEQIIQSLPPGLQGDLKEFGPLETRSTEELHQFMLDMREKHKIAPWCAFTLLIKRAARAAGAGQVVSSENMWYRNTIKKDFCLDDTSAAWCLLNVTVTNKEGSRKATGLYAVAPEKNLIWSMKTETLISGDQVTCYNKNGYQRGVKRSVLMREAKKLLRHDQRSGDVIDVAARVQSHHMKESPRLPQKQENSECLAQPQIEQPVLAMQPPMTQPESGTLTDVQREVLIMVFEMGAAKARELGMHSTIARWRTTLSDIIGPEVHHVND